MAIKRINEFPEGSGTLTNDDIFLVMDGPSGSALTKKVSLGTLAGAIGDIAGAVTSVNGQTGNVIINAAESITTIGTVDLHNGGIQSSEIFQFNNKNYQSVITGPTPAASGDTAQRLIIQGQRAQGGGEGGDVYLWGGDADTNGGDIKIYAGDADSNESGQGGYVNIDAGNGHNQGGQVSISAGNSTLQGGSVNISAGYPSGIVAINTDGSRWEFKPDGKVFLPMSALDVGGDTIDIKSSNYAELWYHSGPSGTPYNYIEHPNNNSDTYLWTTYDGTHIENYRLNDGTNPSWGYEWHFRNDGKLQYPDGTTNSGGTVIAPATYDIQSIENTLIQTSASAQVKTWDFGTDGTLTLPQGSILSETNNTVSLAPPTAASGQSLVIRPTIAAWGLTSSGYIVYGSPITISVTLQNWAYFGTVNYTISGSGVTPQSLGRALTGKLTFVSTSAPDTETITWTIPANSNITEFTLTLTSVDGTRPGPDIADANNYPTLYYNFEEGGMPTGQFVTVTNNGISNSEHSHIHLVAGDPSTVDIYLGDDDQYVKIQKDGGDVIVGTKSEAVVNRLSLITNGTGYAVTPNDVAVLGGSGTGMRVNYANSGNTVIAVALNTLGTGYQDGDILTLSGGNNNCTFRYNNHSAVNNNWTFGTDGRLRLPIDGDILDSNGTSVLGGSGSTTVVDLTFNTTINTDASSGDIFDVTLTDNITLANPTNPVNGKTLRWRITQDSTGSRSVTLGNKFNIPTSASSPLPFSTAANKMDTLAATYHAGRDKWDIVAFVPGY
jgi:hypothetical protein